MSFKMRTSPMHTLLDLDPFQALGAGVVRQAMSDLHTLDTDLGEVESFTEALLWFVGPGAREFLEGYLGMDGVDETELFKAVILCKRLPGIYRKRSKRWTTINYENLERSFQESFQEQ